MFANEPVLEAAVVAVVLFVDEDEDELLEAFVVVDASPVVVVASPVVVVASTDVVVVASAVEVVVSSAIVVDVAAPAATGSAAIPNAAAATARRFEIIAIMLLLESSFCYQSDL